MADVIFRCPSCSKSLVVDQSAIGGSCSCSACSRRVGVPAPVIEFSCTFCSSQLMCPDNMGAELFECPNCETGIPVPHLVSVEFD